MPIAQFKEFGGLAGLQKKGLEAPPSGHVFRELIPGTQASYRTAEGTGQFLSAKDVPYKVPGFVANFYGMTPDNIFAPGQFLNKFQTDAVQKGITSGGNKAILADLRSNKNLLGQNPEQARLLRQYLNTGTVPEGLSTQFAINAYDWAIREQGREQQTKKPGFFQRSLGGIIGTAVGATLGFALSGGNPAMAIKGAKIGGTLGGTGQAIKEDRGLMGTALAAAAGYGTGSLGASAGSLTKTALTQGFSAAGQQALAGLQSQWAGIKSLPQNIRTGVGHAVGTVSPTLGARIAPVITSGSQITPSVTSITTGAAGTSPNLTPSTGQWASRGNQVPGFSTGVTTPAGGAPTFMGGTGTVDRLIGGSPLGASPTYVAGGTVGAPGVLAAPAGTTARFFPTSLSASSPGILETVLSPLAKPVQAVSRFATDHPFLTTSGVAAGLSALTKPEEIPPPGGPTITYPDYDPQFSGRPLQGAQFERLSNIGVPSQYSYVPPRQAGFSYGSGLDPYAPVEGPDFDITPYLDPPLFHRGGGVVNVDSGARPTDQESFYQTYESGSQQYSDSFDEGVGLTYDRIEGTDIPPQSRLQVFETPPMGVGSLNDTARNMTRYAYGGGVGSLNETARTMTYAGGGIVRAAAMAWQPFKVKIKNQAIFGEFMGYTKTGKVRVLDQESGAIALYPKSRVRRAYSDEPLPDRPVKKAVGGPVIKTAAELLKRDPAGFFNKSQLVVQEAKLPQATGQRWQQLFQDKGINKAELGGLGLLTFLGLSRDEPITKEAVADFIDENRLEVGEDYRATRESEAREGVLLGQLAALEGPEGMVYGGYSVGIDPNLRRRFELGQLEEPTRPTNFSVVKIRPFEDKQGIFRPDVGADWTIMEDRGPEEDRVAVMDVSGTLEEVKVKLIELLRERGELAGTEAPRWSDHILGYNTEAEEGTYLIASADHDPTLEHTLNYREIALTDRQTGGLHKNTRELIQKIALSGSRRHSRTQPGEHNFPDNTLVHTRVTDRPVEINGVNHENVLYAEEIQSDWAQGAIGPGILRPEDISRKAELLGKLSEIRVESAADIYDKRKLAIEDELEALDQKQAYSPFLESGDKKGSVDQSPVISLAISRLLKEAVDNGQDYVVFANYNDQVTSWGETKLEPIYQETIPNLAKKIVRDLGGYVKPKFKTKEKENKYYEQHPDERGKEEDAFFADTVFHPDELREFFGRPPWPHEFSGTRFVVHITDAMKKKIQEEGQPVLSRAAGGPIIKGAVKTLTKPKKAPPLPSETLMATTPAKKIPCGDCFGWASKKFVEAPVTGEPVKLYYGKVLDRWGDTSYGKGNYYPHAWIEKDGRFYDWQTSVYNDVKADGWTKKQFEEYYQPQKTIMLNSKNPKDYRKHYDNPFGELKLSKKAAGGPIIKGAVKTLTQSKKAPPLPSETLLAPRPVEPLVTTRTSPGEASRMQRAKEMGFVTEAYHGTTHDIEAFNPVKANPESDWGPATYMTTSIDDVNPNYAGEGPDLTAQIIRRAEQIKDVAAFHDPSLKEEFERIAGVAWGDMDYETRLDAGKELARKELKGSNLGAVYPLKINTEKYAVIGGDNPTYIEISDYRPEAMEEIKRADYDNDDEYEEAVTEYASELESSDMNHPIIEIRGALMRFAGDSDEAGVNRAIEQISEQMLDGMTATRLDEIIRDNVTYLEGPEGEILGAGAASAHVLERLGFEGVIDKTVDIKFGLNRKTGRLGPELSKRLQMEGVYPDTAHIITFPGYEKNIRSKFAKFDPAKKGSADIFAAKGGGVSSLNGIARNMTRGYANGGGVGSMNETARSMFM